MNDFKKRMQKGETLIETLVAVLIITLSSIIFLNMTLSCAKMNSLVQQEDTTFREDLMETEKAETGHPGNVIIKTDQSSYSYEVEYYGKENGMVSYRIVQ